MADKQERIAVIRVRGDIGVDTVISDTLKMLRLFRKNYCVVVPNEPGYMGMVNKAKDYVTFGEISEEAFNLLAEKRGEEYKGRLEDAKGKIKYNKFIIFNNKKIKPFFRLSPPRGGFERKGIKIPFTKGGALGYRKGDINELIKRMV